MSQKITVNNPLTPAIVTTIKTDLNAIVAIITPLIIALTDSQDRGLLVVATSRESEIVAVEGGLMEVFPVTIPTGLTLVQLQAMDQEQKDCAALELMCTSLATFFKVHGKIVGNNRMLWIIDVLDEARILAKNSPGIAAALKVITTDHLTPSPKKGITTFSIAEAAILDVTGLKTDKPFINNGTTILTILGKGISAANLVTINPGNSRVLPAGWTNVAVTNLSASAAGSFQVHLKA